MVNAPYHRISAIHMSIAHLNIFVQSRSGIAVFLQVNRQRIKVVSVSMPVFVGVHHVVMVVQRMAVGTGAA